VRGEIDLATEDALRAALAPALADSYVSLLVCDMSHVTFLACNGLSVLVQARTTLEQRGAALRVVARHGRVLRVFTLAGLNEFLDVTEEPYR
jgi:anti-anti-sigma factor